MLQADGHCFTITSHEGKLYVVRSAKGSDLHEITVNLHTCFALELDQFTRFNGSAFHPTMRPASGDHDDDGSSTSNAEASTADAADVLVLSGSTFNHVLNPRHRHGQSSSPRRSPRTGIAKKQNPLAVIPTQRRQSLMSQAVASRPGWLGPASGGYGHTLAAPTTQPPYSFSVALRPLQRRIPDRTPDTPMGMKPACLVIKWHGHGEEKVTDKYEPSYAALQAAALAHVRKGWRKFENVSAPNFRPDELLSLVVKTVRVEVDGQMYAISTADGDPVFAYFREQGKPPKFEFDVGHSWNNAKPPQP